MIWQGICIHHSATVDSATSSWEAIRHYHINPALNGKTIPLEEYNYFKSRGVVAGLKDPWDEIGYHYGIEDVGGTLRLRIGRPLSMPGAHARGLNKTHIGICMIGDFDRDLPSVTRLDYLALVIADIARNYRLEISPETIKYHRDVADRTCPGELFPPKEALIRMVEKYL